MANAQPHLTARRTNDDRGRRRVGRPVGRVVSGSAYGSQKAVRRAAGAPVVDPHRYLGSVLSDHLEGAARQARACCNVHVPISSTDRSSAPVHFDTRSDDLRTALGASAVVASVQGALVDAALRDAVLLEYWWVALALWWVPPTLVCLLHRRRAQRALTVVAAVEASLLALILTPFGYGFFQWPAALLLIVAAALSSSPRASAEDSPNWVRPAPISVALMAVMTACTAVILLWDGRADAREVRMCINTYTNQPYPCPTN